MAESNKRNNGKNSNNKYEGLSEAAKAFKADLELAEYQHRVEAGELTEEEKEDRKKVLKFLGYPEES